MPIYEYQCKACGHVLDALQKISDEPLRHCPTCGEEALKKLVSAPRFRLKGSGWYETDFKDKNRRNIASDDSGGGKSGAADKSDDKGKAAVKSTDKTASNSPAKDPGKSSAAKPGDSGS
ncbi:MAG: zinc ribbon domain-containing protein [Gammaproteobacteria bacterium]